MRTVNSFIGSPIERLEDLRFLRGRGEYVDDLARPGMLHAAILRSAVAHGRIRSIDAARALTIPGVHSVITAADLGRPVPLVPMRLQPLAQFEPFAQPVIAHAKVRYVGEALAPQQRLMKVVGGERPTDHRIVAFRIASRRDRAKGFCRGAAALPESR